MNIKLIESVVRKRTCPVCETGMTLEVDRKIYKCSHARCGETFDFSLLTDLMMHELLEMEGKNQKSRRGKE